MTRDEYDARKAEGGAKGWVYLIHALGTEAVKVGWALDPVARMFTLQTGQAADLTLIAVLPGTIHLESDLHRRLQRYRIRGEWFERKHVLKLLNPIIETRGIRLMEDAADSRNSPEIPLHRKRVKRTFVVQLQGDI